MFASLPQFAAFNSFPVAVLSSMLAPSSPPCVFQFFPSCCWRDEAYGGQAGMSMKEESGLALIATEVTHEGWEGLVVLSFNSFPVAVRATARINSSSKLFFQFFPSCCESRI
ncbi:MAG: hypothetical protein RMI04_09605 [Thermofilaceae archaeon]|nr:hypothetical protein [Thermofilaceae archaeon]